jgi:cell shape-determining protein MreD
MSTIKIFRIKYITIILLILLQLLINVLMPDKIDLLGVFLLIILVNKYSNYTKIIILSIIADLIGPYHIGTHLISLLIISFISDRYYNFYKILTHLQKNIILITFILLFQLIINIVRFITNNTSNYIYSTIFSLIILPFIYIITNSIYKKSSYKDNLYL